MKRQVVLARNELKRRVPRSTPQALQYRSLELTSETGSRVGLVHRLKIMGALKKIAGL